ncbi:sugar-transfer associated ATP-grasp domain-containing protein [Prosthecochloris sp. HL-130-GSB]|uniref:sugar-transfer associated ATP-grasp domain-containing protein n=1 Tax=Prosthecochloris sp. HL-130-GSB TaxID=1974213 RepID=UPI0018DD7B49|nr:sugar-transfer associated ATP-grasp domain-containing protein [Prosthecochloris sp. HL-130-GSB]MBO8093848.1 hypothetical protein [Prosthecochloris sp.]
MPENFYQWFLLPALNRSDVSRRLGDKRTLELFFPGASPSFLDRTASIWSYKGEAINDAHALELIATRESENGFVVKKPDSARGEDVSFFSGKDRREILDIARSCDDICIQFAVRQCSCLDELHPPSINTVRLLTLAFANEVRFLGGFLRVGRGGKKVDNLHAGGILVHLDPESGHASEYGIDLDLNAYRVHPDTGKLFHSLHIAGWQELCNQVIAFHSSVPEAGFVGWDMAVDDDRFWLLECNTTHPALQLHQYFNPPLFGPVLPDLFEYVTGRRYVMR